MWAAASTKMDACIAAREQIHGFKRCGASTSTNIYKYVYWYSDGKSVEARQVGWNVTQRFVLIPSAVRRDIGHALYTAQEGKTDPSAKPLKGFGGASVLEIVASYRGNAWRAVYTVRFRDAVYVLHVFQKKSTKGIATPSREVELIKRRLADAERDYRERQN